MFCWPSCRVHPKVSHFRRWHLECLLRNTRSHGATLWLELLAFYSALPVSFDEYGLLWAPSTLHEMPPPKNILMHLLTNKFGWKTPSWCWIRWLTAAAYNKIGLFETKRKLSQVVQDILQVHEGQGRSEDVSRLSHCDSEHKSIPVWAYAWEALSPHTTETPIRSGSNLVIIPVALSADSK